MRSLTSLAFVTAVLSGCATVAANDASSSADVTASTDRALAATLPDYCTGPEIIRIARPIASGDATTFGYGFRYRAPTTPGAPVVVNLPGGPGQGSMSDPPDFVPADWGYLETDPRGVGCNQLAELPVGDEAARFFRTEEIAADVIAAIQDRQLTNYVVFGVSYGTLLATTVAHHLEGQHLPAPKAVVLEGVLGETFGHDDSNFAGENFVAQFKRIHDALPADVIDELDHSATPFGLTRDELTRAMMAFMPASPELAAEQLAGLSHTLEGVTDDIRAQALATLKSVGDTLELSAPSEVALYRYVACREIMDTVPASDMDVVFSQGYLVRNRAEEGTKCGDLEVTAPYDSAKLQFSAPLFYFIGDSDVATPPWQGFYHYDHHTGPATKTVTTGGGHNSLRFNQKDCAANVMGSIGNGGADLQTVLATCPLPVTVDKK